MLSFLIRGSIVITVSDSTGTCDHRASDGDPDRQQLIQVHRCTYVTCHYPDATELAGDVER